MPVPPAAGAAPARFLSRFRQKASATYFGRGRTLGVDDQTKAIERELLRIEESAQKVDGVAYR